jgi:F0F1-type ATP synthase assembly protein I
MYNKHIQKKRKKKKKAKKEKERKEKAPQEKQTFTLNKSFYSVQALVYCKC